MSLIVAHAAHAWLEAALFAPAAVVVTAAVVRSVVRGRTTPSEHKEHQP
ncbi:MAG TPA: hypothetical protein VGR12_00545 [Solirubrobacteraceae bacterium]|nr:hypothetical protein [Solirubrobacteraceae bacterium]